MTVCYMFTGKHKVSLYQTPCSDSNGYKKSSNAKMLRRFKYVSHLGMSSLRGLHRWRLLKNWSLSRVWYGVEKGNSSMFSRRFLQSLSRSSSSDAQSEAAADFRGSEISKKKKKKKQRVPVLIVGAGPVGLSLSILLSQYGKLGHTSRIFPF
jgi:hypothetical protein